MDDKTIALVIAALSCAVALIWNIWSQNYLKSKDSLTHENRLTTLETKMGLLWGVVEEIMVKHLPANPNPIEFTQDEQAAWNAYQFQKSNTPTPILRKLEAALERNFVEKENIPQYEVIGYALALVAIKSQLVDRGELVTKVPSVRVT